MEKSPLRARKRIVNFSQLAIRKDSLGLIKLHTRDDVNVIMIKLWYDSEKWFNYETSCGVSEIR